MSFHMRSPNSFRKIFLTAVASPLLCGCASLHEQSIDHSFEGIKSAMHAKPIICVLFVHGMGGYSNGKSPGDSNEDPAHLIDAILKMPNIRQTAGPHAVSMGDDTATLVRQDFVDTQTHAELRTYKLDWEPLTVPLKEKYLAYDQEPALNARRLDLVGSNIRAGILDGAVPDVILYVGHYKPVIQHAVKMALKRMHQDIESRDDKQKDYEYVFVTWSLGSKIVFDCLADPNSNDAGLSSPTTQPDADDVVYKKIALKTRSVYMLANQLPLLTLADVQPPATPGSSAPAKAIAKPYQAVKSVAQRRNVATSEPITGAPTATPKLSIVAFSDPNDLLSYPLPGWLQSDEAIISNVSISVVKSAIYIPFLGWVYNPEPAHTGYAIDDKVVDLILNGGTADPAGKR